MQSDGQNLYLKSHQHVSKNRTKIQRFGATGGQNRPNGAQESSESDLGSKSVLGPPKNANARCAAHAFGYHMGDLGRHFEHRWPPRGSQNQQFWHQVALKFQKMTSRMRHQKKLASLIEFCRKNMRFWMCWTHRNALYISISVVLPHYNNISYFI